MRNLKLVFLGLLAICFSCTEKDGMNIIVKNETNQRIQSFEFFFEGNPEVLSFENIAPGEEREEYYEKLDPKNEKTYNIKITKADGDAVELKGGYYRRGLFIGTPTLNVNIGEDDISTEVVDW